MTKQLSLFDPPRREVSPADPTVHPESGIAVFYLTHEPEGFAR